MKLKLLLLSSLLSTTSFNFCMYYPSEEELNERLRECNLEDVITYTDLTHVLAYSHMNMLRADIAIMEAMEKIKPIMAKRASLYGQRLSNQNAVNDFRFLKSCLGPDFYKNR